MRFARSDTLRPSRRGWSPGVGDGGADVAGRDQDRPAIDNIPTFYHSCFARSRLAKQLS